MQGKIIWAQDSIKLIEYQGEAAVQASPTLARMRMNYFCEFPYLYKGDIIREQQNCAAFAARNGACIILAHADKQIVGVAAHIPLVHAWDELKTPFIKAKLDPSQYHYFGESILAPAYRGLGLSKHINRHIEQHAKGLGARFVTAMTVVRDASHPLCPKDYIPFENYMHHFNYSRIPLVNAKFTWATMPDGIEQEHELEFWKKEV